MHGPAEAEPPVGPPVAGWRPPPVPVRRDLSGRWSAVEALEPAEHAADLFDAFADDPSGRLWTYMGYGPFAGRETFEDWLDAFCTGTDPLFFALRDLGTGRVGGLAAYMRVAPSAGTIEIGHISLGPRLQRRRAATEAVSLMIRHAFALGYRRLEWKCDALNAPSRRAAERLGFRFEGVFRQAAVVKGRNRDTAWFAMLDGEAPAVLSAHDAWLAPTNFDADGMQRRSLAAMLAEARSEPAPAGS